MPLYFAVRNRHFDVCDYILKNINDINSRNNNGHAPLDPAFSSFGQYFHMQLLGSPNGFYAIFLTLSLMCRKFIIKYNQALQFKKLEDFFVYKYDNQLSNFCLNKCINLIEITCTILT